MRIPKELLRRASLEEGEDPDARFLRASIGRKYGHYDVVEYRAQLTRTLDVVFEVWINGRVLTSGKASSDPDLYLRFQAAAEQVRMEMLDRQIRLRSREGAEKVQEDASRLLEPE
jgi:hypothetical protein